jgi:hypothetical protein
MRMGVSVYWFRYSVLKSVRLYQFFETKGEMQAWQRALGTCL